MVQVHKIKLAFMNESISSKWDTVEELDIAINEGVGYGSLDPCLIPMQESFIDDVMGDVLDNVKEVLLQLCATVANVVNNFIVNTAKLMEVYEPLIKERFDKLSSPFKVSMYKYSLDSKYPCVVGSRGNPKTMALEIRDAIITKNLCAEDVAGAVDDAIDTFAMEVVNVKVGSGYDISGTIMDEVKLEIRGSKSPITHTVTKSSLQDYITMVKDYKSLKDNVESTKRAVIADYNTLKSAHASCLKEWKYKSLAERRNELDYPGVNRAIARDTANYDSISYELTRLFNSYITIYNSAFNAKLNVMQEMVHSYRSILDEILRRTNLFAELNTHEEFSKSQKAFKPDLKDSIYT